MTKKEFVVLLSLTVFVILVWVASDIYHTRSNIEISPKLQQVLEPIEPSFDTTVLEKINQVQPIPVSLPQATSSAEDINAN